MHMEHSTTYLDFAETPKAKEWRVRLNNLTSTGNLSVQDAKQKLLNENPDLRWTSEVYAIALGAVPYTAEGAAFASWWQTPGSREWAMSYAQQDKEWGSSEEWAAIIFRNQEQFPKQALNPFYQEQSIASPSLPAGITAQQDAIEAELETAAKAAENGAASLNADIFSTLFGSQPNLNGLTDVEKVALWLEHSNETVPVGTRAAAENIAGCQGECQTGYLLDTAKALALDKATVANATEWLQKNPEYARTDRLPKLRIWLKSKAPLERLAIVLLAVFLVVAAYRMIAK